MDSRNRNRSLATAFAVVVFGMSFGAFAQTATTDAQAQAQVASAQADAAVAADAQVAANTDAANAKRTSNVGCVKDTGTNIRPRDPKTGKALCIGPGRSYSREQIDRTGQTDLADALRRLDPSVR
ncbi:hypothetical protein L3D22_16170 [Lysobacter soli]|uniref:hypothetical protein n=1 Tax=Lysobacter soli TaxID=453783 RepID=UPI0020A0C805|nr:hypothetical protein [Lysobacter soli]UTA53846.1 hypothetical protein L3D22_16170 [Lysobacter soli]